MRILSLEWLSMFVEHSQNQTHHRLAFFRDGLEAVVYLTLDDMSRVSRALFEYVAEENQPESQNRPLTAPSAVSNPKDAPEGMDAGGDSGGRP